jgi:abhydrolase domain-containing protein 17
VQTSSRLLQRLLRMVLTLLIGAYIALALFAVFLSERVMFQPQPSSYRDDATILKVPTTDGEIISAMYLPNPDAKLTILFSHGNAEDIGDLRPLLQELRQLGFAVFAYDYHGYGTSTGDPSEAAAIHDINAAHAYLTGTLKIPSEHIVLYGRSVGSGPTLNVAPRVRSAGVIIESGFTSAFRVLTRVPLLPFDRFRNISTIGKVNAPVLIMHGKADTIIPFSHGAALFAAAAEPKRSLWIETAGHNDFTYIAGERYYAALREFKNLLEREPEVRSR